MKNFDISSTTDFSEYSRDDLLSVVNILQQENGSLCEYLQKLQQSLLGDDERNFRRKYAEKILDALPDMLTVVADDATTVAIVSSEETNHSGIPCSEIYGVPIDEFLPRHVCKHVMDSIEEAKMYGKSSNLSHLMYVDDKPRYFENRTVRIDNKYNLCICRDITDDMLTKMQFESLSYATNLVNENIYSLNSDGAFLFANKQFLLDHECDDVVGKYAYGIMFSCRTKQDWVLLKEKMKTNNGEISYVHVHHVDGKTEIVYDVVVRSIKNINNDDEYWFFARNITNSVQREKKIKELGELMDAIVENIPMYLFVKDAADFKYLYWNKALEDSTDITTEQAIGHTDDELFPVNEYTHMRRSSDMELIEHNTPTMYIETFTNKRGKVSIMKTVKVPVVRHDQPPLIIGAALDITDIKDAEKKLIEAKFEAEESNRLKSAFLANMSHEIRTPLNAIVGFAKIIMSEEDIESRHEYSNIIESNADLLLQLINDILDLSKIEAGTLDFVMSEVNLDELCGNMLNIHRMKMPQGVSLIYEETGDELAIECDRNRLSQVLTNLLSNAIKSTSSGSIRFGYALKGADVEVFVRDTGIGIPAEKLSFVFDRFVKLNTFTSGTGLGLAITKTIIERLGGVISVVSEEGVGTEFRFSIPYKDCSLNKKIIATEKSAVIDNSISVEEKCNCILIVEDNDSNYLLITKLLKDRYICYRAINGEEAIDMFLKHQPNLIFMDIKMQGMDGLEATRIIRAHSSDVAIVVLTAFAYDSDKDAAFKAGCNHFITKPIVFDQLQSILDRYMFV